MKKAYAKPDILFESFAANTSIATCEDEVPAQKGVCAYVVSAGTNKSWNVFTSNIPNCTTNENNLNGMTQEMYNQFCYDVPLGGMPLFGS